MKMATNIIGNSLWIKADLDSKGFIIESTEESGSQNITKTHINIKAHRQ